jgi:putative SOS response-associated peptidase YedK
MHTSQELVELYHLTMAAPSNLELRYNICPTDTINIVVRGGEASDFARARMAAGVPGLLSTPARDGRPMRCSARQAIGVLGR